MSSGINLALVGASGVVGDKIISLLEKKDINVSNFYPLGFSSVGRAVSFNNKSFIIEDLSNFDSSKAHLAIFSAGSKVAKEYANDFVANGCYVVDLSSEYRYDDQVPLIIPEINDSVLPLELVSPNISLLFSIRYIQYTGMRIYHNFAKIKNICPCNSDSLKE